MNALCKWPTVRLGDHADLLTGFPFKSEKYSTVDDDIPLVKGENVQQGFIDWSIAKRWPKSELHQYAKFRLRRGDVILAMDRPWVTAGLKFSWIRPGDPECLLVQRTARLRGSDCLDTDFIRYLIGSKDFTNYIRPIVTGVNVPHISPDLIKDFRFPLPPLPVQQRIVSILSSYDDLIENNRRRVEILEEMARKLYREWFIHFRFPGHDTATFVDSPLGRIPQEWEVKSFAACVEVNPTVRVPRAGEKPFVPMTCLSTNSMVIGEIETREGNSGAKFQNGDTLFARITPCLENGKTGFVQFLPNKDAAGFGSTEFIVLRSKTLSPEMVYVLARSSEFRNHAIKSMSGATGRQRVQEACFGKYEIAQPPAALVEKYTDFVRPVFAAVHGHHRQNENLCRTRDLLLPKLVSGEVSLDGSVDDRQ